MRTSVALHGTWRVTVVRKESDWAQRVVAAGAESGVLPGVLGATATMGGGSWRLTAPSATTRSSTSRTRAATRSPAAAS